MESNVKPYAVLIGAALATFASVIAPARAETVLLGDVQLEIPLPQGYCALTKDQPADAASLDLLTRALAGRNRLLAFSADCQELKEWRAGARPFLKHFSQVQALEANIDHPIPGAPAAVIRATCNEIRQQGQEITASLVPEMDLRIASVTSELKIGGVQFLGLVGQDESACYAAMAEKVSTGSGKEANIVGVFAILDFKGRFVYHYLFWPAEELAVVTRMLEVEKKEVAAFVEANRDN
jgi:hypothetical protein